MIDFGSSWASSWWPLGPSWGLRVPFWERLGVILGAQDGPKIGPKSPRKIHFLMLRAQDALKTDQDLPKTIQDAQIDSARPPKMPKTTPQKTTNDPKLSPRRPQTTPKTKEDKEPDEMTRQDGKRENKRRQDKTRHHKTPQDKARKEKRQDRQDEIRREKKDRSRQQ